MDEFSWDALGAAIADFLDSAWARPVWVIIIIVAGLLLRWLLLAIIRRLVTRVVTGVKRKQGIEDTQALESSPLAAVRVVQRTRAMGSVANSVVTAVIGITSVILIVAIVAPEATGAFSLITAALGAGLGFGAQNWVKDVLNGLSMVAEDQMGVGDVVDLGMATGVVESIGIRITQVRDVNGTLWFVRNGEITRVGNMSQSWARVIIDLAVPYETDVDAVQHRIFEVSLDLAKNSKWRSRIIDEPEVWGIQSISADAIVLRLVMKTVAAARDDVGRELRARLKGALDELGIKLPSLATVVLTGTEGATSVRGARAPRTRPVPLSAPPPNKGPKP